MENSKTKSAKSASQPQLPFSNTPIDWTQGVECRFGQLADVVELASLRGFHPVRMTVIRGGYRIEFERNQNATILEPQAQAGIPPKKTREPLICPLKARQSCIPVSLYDWIFRRKYPNQTPTPENPQ